MQSGVPPSWKASETIHLVGEPADPEMLAPLAERTVGRAGLVAVQRVVKVLEFGFDLAVRIALEVRLGHGVHGVADVEHIPLVERQALLAAVICPAD
jgi:hypothetical protein